MNLLSFIFILALALGLQIKEIHEVIIIGAGISGLRASQMLSDQKIPHLILQSTDHVGGRISPMEFEGIKVDRGASFIHDSRNNNPLGKIVSDLGWPYANGTCSYRVMFEQGKKNAPIPREDIVQAHKMYFALVEIMEKQLQNAKDVSIAESIKGLAQKNYPQESEIRKRVVDFMFKIQGNIDGSQVTNLSAKMRTYKETKNDRIPLTGFHELFHVIFHFIGGKVLFHQRVHTIDYSSELIKVTTNKQTFYAKKVISSLPLGILKAGKVKFIPQLPAVYQQSIQNIGNGYADKLYVSFKNRFWGNRTGWLSFVTKTQQNKYPVAFIVPSASNMLIFFVSGQASLKISKWSDFQILNDLQDFLTLFFRICQVEIKAVKLTRWHMDQNTLGSYSNYKVGTTEQDFIEISKPINDKLWFIGEHTHPKLNSYAHGAYVSGEIAGQQVIVSLNNMKNQQQNKTIIPETPTKPLEKVPVQQPSKITK